MLKDDPMDLHSRAIIELYSKFLDKDIPIFGSYLASRLFQTKAHKRIKRGVPITYYLASNPVTIA